MVPFNIDAAELRADNSSKNTDPRINKNSTIAEIASGNLQKKVVANSSNSLNSSESFIDINKLNIKVKYIRDVNTAERAIAILSQSSLLSIDIETMGKNSDSRSGLDPHQSQIRLMQFYDGGAIVYVFDCINREVMNTLRDSSIWCIPCVAHNAVFEIKHLNHAGIMIDNIGCTMLQNNALTGDLPSLSKLANRYFNSQLSKSCQVSDWSIYELTQEQIEYAALDAVVTFEIAHIQADELSKKRATDIYRLMKGSQQAIADMERHGFLFNIYKHQELILKWKIELNSAYAELSKILKGINFNSGKQLAAWLREHVEQDLIEQWPVTPTGQLKTDTKTFSRYPNLEVTKPILIYKNLSKKLSTYGETYLKYINPVTGRIHGNYRLGGNVTGRIPCSNPNLQQIPRDPEFRSLFIAPDGCKLIVADYSQIQLRVAALLSKDKRMLELFSSGEDLHKSTAAAILAIPASKVTKQQRQMGKAVSFGLLFGQGAKGLSIYAKSVFGVQMSMEDATKARSTFMKTYPHLARWQRITGGLAKRTMQIKTPTGRVRYFNKERLGYKFTEALNTPIQGAESEILMSVFNTLRVRNWQNLKLVNIVHDELIFEVPKSHVDTGVEKIREIMIHAFLDIFPEGINMTKDLVDINVGDNWSDAK